MVICVYRAPTGIFHYFLNQLETILNKLHNVSTNLILCGDFNINHLEDNSRKQLLESLLAKFPTRICNDSSTLIDNIYINTNSLNFSVHPVTNGLSDHDAQVINLFNILSAGPSYPLSFSRKINRNSICKFTDLLSYENWDDVFFRKQRQHNIQQLILEILMHASQPSNHMYLKNLNLG